MDDVIMDRRTEEAPAQDARLKVRKKKKKRVNSSFLNYLFNNPGKLCQNVYHSGTRDRLWCHSKRDLWHNSCVIAELLEHFCPLRNWRSGRFLYVYCNS